MEKVLQKCFCESWELVTSSKDRETKRGVFIGKREIAQLGLLEIPNIPPANNWAGEPQTSSPCATRGGKLETSSQFPLLYVSHIRQITLQWGCDTSQLFLITSHLWLGQKTLLWRSPSQLVFQRVRRQASWGRRQKHWLDSLELHGKSRYFFTTGSQVRVITVNGDLLYEYFLKILCFFRPA